MFLIIFYLCVSHAISILFGALFFYIKMNRHPSGVLRIDRSFKDEPPVMFLELTNAGFDDIYKKQVVSFKVLKSDYLSEESDNK